MYSGDPVSSKIGIPQAEWGRPTDGTAIWRGPRFRKLKAPGGAGIRLRRESAPSDPLRRPNHRRPGRMANGEEEVPRGDPGPEGHRKLAGGANHRLVAEICRSPGRGAGRRCDGLPPPLRGSHRLHVLTGGLRRPATFRRPSGPQFPAAISSQTAPNLAPFNSVHTSISALPYENQHFGSICFPR